jgi:hypothetical protein
MATDPPTPDPRFFHIPLSGGTEPEHVDMLTWPHGMNEAVLPLLKVEGYRNVVIPRGSCFCIGPDILLTAGHNVKDAFDIAPERAARQGVFFATAVLQPVAGEHGSASFRLRFIQGVSYSDHGDTAALTLHPDADAPPPAQMRLTFRLPHDRESVAALGYPDLDGQVMEAQSLRIQASLRASSGTVRAVYPDGRDLGAAPYPCIESDIPIHGGMSGGPVSFSGQGAMDGDFIAVGGVATRGWDFGDGFSSVAAITPPLLGLNVDREIDGVRKQWTLLELAEKGVIQSDGTHEGISIVRENGGHIVVW